MKRIDRIALWVIYKAMEKAFLLLLIFSFIVLHVRLGMTVLGYIPFDQTIRMFSAILMAGYCFCLCSNPRKSPCRAVFAGWSLGFFIDNMGAMRYYYKVSVCLFAGHTPENQV